jgi:hypothetical protein
LFANIALLRQGGSYIAWIFFSFFFTLNKGRLAENVRKRVFVFYYLKFDKITDLFPNINEKMSGVK